MIFYNNTELIDEVYEPSEIISEGKFLKMTDIKNFNFYLFESDLEKLNDEEFQNYFSNIFEILIDEVNETYLDIDIQEIRKDTIKNKRLFVKKFVIFYMQLLPYEILKPIFKNSAKLMELYSSEDFINEEEFKTPSETLLYRLFDYDNDNIYKIKKLLCDQIDIKITKMHNFNNIIDEIAEISKKNTLENSRDIFEEHIRKQNKYYEIYKSIILQTDLEKLVNLFRQYIEKDYLNLIN